MREGNAAAVLDRKDRELLDVLQGDFPLEDRPYRAVGASLGTSEQETMSRIARLREAGIIRQLSAIFDTRKLGYKSTLVAARLPEDRLEAGAATVSRHPGVSHNYLRPHDYNLWFTLAVEPGQDLESTLDALATEAGFEGHIALPTVRVFRIGVRLDMVGGNAPAPDTQAPVPGGGTQEMPPLSDADKEVIRELQRDFPAVERPYAPMAERLGISQEALFGWAREMMACGRLRRISAVYRHREAGFTANAMVVWQVPADRVEEVGTFCAQIPQISHCYERPTYDDWPYSLYTMIHGREERACEAVVQQVLDAFGDIKHQILYSTREFKKERVRYFVSE